MLTDPQSGLELPAPYPWLQKQGFKLPLPWKFLESARESERLRQEFRNRLVETIPVRDLFPFAACQSPTEVAGFVVQGGSPTPQVVSFNLRQAQNPEPSGWPGYRVHDDLWAWLRDQVLEDARRAERA